MDQAFIDVLITSSKIAPVIAVLWLAVRYFLKKEKVYQAKINDLQTELRANEKESLQTLNKLTGVLDKLITNSAEDKKEILAELSSIHRDLNKKLNDIKKEK